MDMWVVITTMDPAYTGDDGLASVRKRNRQRAEAFGVQAACHHACLRVEVFSPGGALEYLYDRRTHPAWSPQSEEAISLHQRQISMLFD